MKANMALVVDDKPALASCHETLAQNIREYAKANRMAFIECVGSYDYEHNGFVPQGTKLATFFVFDSVADRDKVLEVFIDRIRWSLRGSS